MTSQPSPLQPVYDRLPAGWSMEYNPLHWLYRLTHTGGAFTDMNPDALVDVNPEDVEPLCTRIAGACAAYVEAGGSGRFVVQTSTVTCVAVKVEPMATPTLRGSVVTRPWPA